VTFGILQRYVMGEVVRAFVMALLSMTIIFVLFMVMAEAANMRLSPRDIMTLVPFVVPGTLTYTVPVSMLFAVTVVYGRLASDNEVIAVKTAGLSALSILWPAIIMGAALSALLLYLSSEAIPRANQQAKLAIFKNFEDAFYKVLKIERGFNNPDWPFLIKVRDVDVETRTMFMATFKHRNKADRLSNPYDMVVQAKQARIDFDMEKGEARVLLVDGQVIGGSKQRDFLIINNDSFVMPLPDKHSKGFDKRIQEFTRAELIAEQAKLRLDIARERKRQAIAASLWFASGRPERVDWRQIQRAFNDYGFWTLKHSEYETEKQLRVAQSFGPLMFVILGAPVGILFAKRDFLSAFITCFVPIIVVYYPLMLLGVNLGKEDVINPAYSLWGGNLLLWVLSWFVWPAVLKH
jgi:lipopolysaccharide export system permease protein